MKTGDDVLEKTSHFVVDKPKSLFKIEMVDRGGQMVENQKVITHDIKRLPQHSTHEFSQTRGGRAGAVLGGKVPQGGNTNLVENPDEVFYTSAQVAEHASPEDCWSIYESRIYDITAYSKVHPGGKKEIYKGAGKDMTQLFKAEHPWINVKYLIGKFQVGYLKEI